MPGFRPHGLRSVALGLCLAGAGLSTACTSGIGSGGDTDVVAADPTKTGPFGADRSFGTVDLGPRTGGFASQVPVLTVQPRALADDQPAGWAVFLPEADKDKEQYGNTAMHLASWGFVVVVPQLDNLGSRRTDTEMLADIQALVAALGNDAIEVEVRHDPAKLALAGHGRGGRLALLAATAVPDVKAVFAASPVDGDGTDPDTVSVVPNLAGSLEVPVGLFGAGRADDVAEGEDAACAPEGEDYRAVWASLRTDGLRVDLPDGGHGDLVEDCIGGQSDPICTGCRAGEDARVTANTMRAAMAAHLGAEVRGDASLAAFWGTNYLDALAPNARVETRRATDPPSVGADTAGMDTQAGPSDSDR